MGSDDRKAEIAPTQQRRYYPSAPLSAFVRCLWYWEGAPKGHSKERLLPNGEASIIFNLRDEPLRIYDPLELSRYRDYGTALLSGAHSNCFAIDTCQQERVVGIQFRPGGAFPFFKTPASEVAETSVDLNDLWSGRASEIREQLLATTSAEQMLHDLARHLLEELARPLQLHPAVSYAMKQFSQGNRVSDVSSQIGLSSRRFLELFQDQVGLTPKVFCRVRRFQKVIETVHKTTELDWVDIALDCGYYDQPHFVHDFRKFSGLTPTKYVEAATVHLNHVRMS